MILYSFYDEGAGLVAMQYIKLISVASIFIHHDE